jgi:hypothetical protein
VKRWQPRPCRRGVWCGGRPRSARRQPRLRAAGGRAGRADGRRHEHTDILPYDLVGGIPKEALGSRVERLDDAPLVNGDDPVHRGLQNGVRASLSRSTAAACCWTTTSSVCCWYRWPAATWNACSEPCKAASISRSPSWPWAGLVTADRRAATCCCKASIWWRTCWAAMLALAPPLLPVRVDRHHRTVNGGHGQQVADMPHPVWRRCGGASVLLFTQDIQGGRPVGVPGRHARPRGPRQPVAGRGQDVGSGADHGG